MKSCDIFTRVFIQQGCRHVVWLAFLLVCLMMVHASWAQSPHPFAVPESRVPVAESGWLAEFYGQMSFWQSHFYRQLNDAVKGLAHQPWAAGWLMLLSFAYGVFHALGPGHGKAVLSAYVLANRETIRNGAILAMVSAMIQALVAVLLVSVAAWALNLTGAALNTATRWLEAGSALMLVGLGLWLVWRHVLSPIGRTAMQRWRADHPRLGRHSRGHTAAQQHGHDHSHAQQHLDHAHGAHLKVSHHPAAHLHAHSNQHVGQHGHQHEHHHHVHDDACGCGHAHVPPPEMLSGRLNWARAWSAVLSMGLRPCTGAVLVLVFSLSQGMFMAGIVSTFAMGLGTGITVALLAMGSLLVSRLAEGAAGGAGSALGRGVVSLLQALAAIAVLMLGLVLLGTSLIG